MNRATPLSTLFPRRSIPSLSRWMMGAVLASTISLGQTGLMADTVTWSSGATSTSWALGTNWADGAAPVAGDDVVVSAGHSFNPTNNAGYSGITIRSLTLTGASSLTLGAPLSVGAGGVWNNMAVNSLSLNGIHLAADQVWGGTRTIFSTGAVTGARLTIDVNTSVRFEQNSSSWSSGIDVRTAANMNNAPFTAGTLITPFGTGTITLTNQRLDGTTSSTASLGLASRAENQSMATANILANNIALQTLSSGSGGFRISQSQDSADQALGHFYILSGVISGTGSATRTLAFHNAKGGAAAPATFILTGENSYTAGTKVEANTTLQIGNDTSTGKLGSGAVENVGGLIFRRSNRYEVANSITGAGTVAQQGTGTTVLTGTYSYSGTTTASDGGLFMDGAHSGAGNYNIQSTLGGSGSIAFDSGNSLTVQSGGVIAPGSDDGSVGTLSLNGGATSEVVAEFLAGASFLFHLDADLETSSSIELLNGAAGDLVFHDNRIDFGVVGSLSGGQSYTLFSAENPTVYAGLGIDEDGRIISGLEIGDGLGGFGGYLTLSSGSIVLHAVPEPGTFALLCGALIGVGLLRRRR